MQSNSPADMFRAVSEEFHDAGTEPGQRGLVLATGLGFLGLLAGVFFVSNVVPSPGYPSPFQDLDTVESFFSTNQDAVRGQSLLLAVTSIVLLGFVASLVGWLRETVGRRTPLLWVSFAGGVLGSGLVMLSAMFVWTLSRAETIQDPAMLRTLHDVTYLMGGPAHVISIMVFVSVASVVMRDAEGFPRWIYWWGTIGAAVSALAVVGLVWEPATFVLVASRVVLGVWVLGVCVTLARRRVGQTPANQPAVTARSGSEGQHQT